MLDFRPARRLFILEFFRPIPLFQESFGLFCFRKDRRPFFQGKTAGAKFLQSITHGGQFRQKGAHRVCLRRRRNIPEKRCEKGLPSHVQSRYLGQEPFVEHALRRGMLTTRMILLPVRREDRLSETARGSASAPIPPERGRSRRLKEVIGNQGLRRLRQNRGRRFTTSRCGGRPGIDQNRAAPERYWGISSRPPWRARRCA